MSASGTKRGGDTHVYESLDGILSGGRYNGKIELL